MESHQFCNINQDFFQNFFTKFEKITLFCISICIMKLINQKNQNNFFSAQIIVLGMPSMEQWENFWQECGKYFMKYTYSSKAFKIQN